LPSLGRDGRRTGVSALVAAVPVDRERFACFNRRSS